MDALIFKIADIGCRLVHDAGGIRLYDAVCLGSPDDRYVFGLLIWAGIVVVGLSLLAILSDGRLLVTAAYTLFVAWLVWPEKFPFIHVKPSSLAGIWSTSDCETLKRLDPPALDRRLSQLTIPYEKKIKLGMVITSLIFTSESPVDEMMMGNAKEEDCRKFLSEFREAGLL
jgi:hypothetical protein